MNEVIASYMLSIANDGSRVEQFTLDQDKDYSTNVIHLYSREAVLDLMQQLDRILAAIPSQQPAPQLKATPQGWVPISWDSLKQLLLGAEDYDNVHLSDAAKSEARFGPLSGGDMVYTRERERLIPAINEARKALGLPPYE